jgi:hypothetical protein
MQQAMWVADLEVSIVAEAIKSTPELQKKEAQCITLRRKELLRRFLYRYPPVRVVETKGTV